MHNRALHDSLAAFVEEAAWQLADEVSGGAEVPFELIEQGRRLGAAVLLPPADRPLHRRPRRRAGQAPVLRRRRAGPRPRCPTCRPTCRRRGRRTPSPDAARAGRRRAAGVPHRGVGGVDRLRLRPRALRRPRSPSSRRPPTATARWRSCWPPSRAWCSRATRSRSATASRSCAPATLGDAPDELRADEMGDGRDARARRRRPATTARSRTPAGACAGSRPRCACGTTPSRRSARARGRAPAAARGCAVPLATGVRRDAATTACSAPRRRTRCARSARWSPAARRAAASWPGRCGGSSSAASARTPSRR